MGNQMEPQNQKKETLESLYALLRENEEKSNREWGKIWKLQEETTLHRKESEEKSNREWEKIRKMQEETARQMEKTDEKLREMWIKTARQMEKTDEKLREMGINIGGIGNSNGDVAEEYFINAFKENPSLNGEIYNKVIHNVRFKPADLQKLSEYDDEFDLFLSNKNSAAIIEIKYNVKEKHINRLLEKGKNYRKYFLGEDGDGDFKLYLGMASLSFRKTDEDKILKEGIAVIKQEAGKLVINTENLKEF